MSIVVENITCLQGSHPVLHDVSIEARAGRVLALVGPNGAGKSTLLAAMSGDLPCTQGRILLDGRPLSAWKTQEMARRRAMLLQSNDVAFAFTAEEVVRMGRTPWTRSDEAARDDEVVARSMEITDVTHLADRPYRSLSGGERARVSLARVLAQQTQTVLLDEPTAALDLRHQEGVMTTARDLAREGRAVVVVIHDLSLAAAYADDVAVLAAGRIVATGSADEVLTADRVGEVYATDVHRLTSPEGHAVIVPVRAHAEVSSAQTIRAAADTDPAASDRSPDSGRFSDPVSHHRIAAPRPSPGGMMSSMTTTESAPGLAAMLREGSKAEHTEAENSTFMSELLAGRVDGAGYTQYLARLRKVYAALESVAADLRDDPIASAVIDPDIERLAAIDADLAFWADGAVPEIDSPATDAYVAAIETTRENPALFVAHHYTRYLGDLSGGQAIGRILSRTFDLTDGEGVQFYAFPTVPKPKPYKDAYRARLDALPLDEVQRDAVVAEARRAFALNGDVFDELTRVVLC